LVNDLLDVSRINRGALRIEREVVDVNQSVRAAVEAVRRQADAKGLTLEFDLPASPVYVEADSERFAQILDNLLSNALKYTEHGRITARVQRNTAQALITIRDTGIGMNPDQARSLFDTAHQTEEGARRGGLGMGLQLVKRLVNTHEGTIEFRSEGSGLGSEVTFTLPLLRSAPPTVPSSAGVAVPPASRRILIIDDQPDTADALGLLLESMGQKVRVSYDGDDAIEIAREQRPQVAFIDLSMPGTNGAEVARRLRQEFSPNQLTLVALSGYSRDHPMAQSMQFEHHLLKPATVENIITLLNSLPMDR
ncbi:MAG: response regulator, partial [Deltaproteobacteria bacterium]|nr:response regulator [Deltaproteobacteria bacterium]